VSTVAHEKMVAKLAEIKKGACKFKGEQDIVEDLLNDPANAQLIDEYNAEFAANMEAGL